MIFFVTVLFWHETGVDMSPYSNKMVVHVDNVIKSKRMRKTKTSTWDLITYTFFFTEHSYTVLSRIPTNIHINKMINFVTALFWQKNVSAIFKYT